MKILILILSVLAGVWFALFGNTEYTAKEIIQHARRDWVTSLVLVLIAALCAFIFYFLTMIVALRF